MVARPMDPDRACETDYKMFCRKFRDAAYGDVVSLSVS
jgi:hypothetical protein